MRCAGRWVASAASCHVSKCTPLASASLCELLVGCALQVPLLLAHEMKMLSGYDHVRRSVSAHHRGGRNGEEEDNTSDCDRHSIDFDRFYDPGATPDSLLLQGIYDRIACPLKGGAWRTTSLSMLVEHLGRGETFHNDSMHLERLHGPTTLGGQIGILWKQLQVTTLSVANEGRTSIWDIATHARRMSIGRSRQLSPAQKSGSDRRSYCSAMRGRQRAVSVPDNYQVAASSATAATLSATAAAATSSATADFSVHRPPSVVLAPLSIDDTEGEIEDDGCDTEDDGRNADDDVEATPPNAPQRKYPSYRQMMGHGTPQDVSEFSVRSDRPDTSGGYMGAAAQHELQEVSLELSGERSLTQLREESARRRSQPPVCPHIASA